ncbi:MAG TPA: hypothetical protein VF529_05505 [Solirubrobacteraceae bacterium]|jgi:hypothetical protein
MSTLKQFQAEVAARMNRGDTFTSVEDEVIDPSGLSDREKAALWLYGWSFVDWRGQRREALSHIDLLAARAETVEFSPPRLSLVRAGGAG